MVLSSLQFSNAETLDARQSQSSWKEISTGGYSGTEATFATKLDRLVAIVPEADGGTLAGQALVRAMPGNSLCELRNCVGPGGAIAISEAGTDGPFLAVYRDAGATLRVACRAAVGAPLQDIPMGTFDGDEVRIHCRGGVVYSYAVESGGLVEPLVAVELDLGDGPLLGILGLGSFSCDEPHMDSLPATLAHTFDLDPGQTGTSLSPSWAAREAPAAVNGRFLHHPSGDGDASAKVTIRDLFQGSYDAWMSDHPADATNGELHVVVDSRAGKSAFAISQRSGGGIWLGLGRHRVSGGDSLSFDFRRAAGSLEPVSLDAVHLVWSQWRDEDRNALPDEWEDEDSSFSGIVSSGTARSDDVYPLPVGRKLPVASVFRQPSVTSADELSAGGDKVVVFVDAYVGDDSYDGRAESVQPGPWHSTRRGPLRTIKEALRLAGNAPLIELCLHGPLEQPPGGFQNNHGGTLMLRAARNGTVMIILDSAEDARSHAHPAAPVPARIE